MVKEIVVRRAFLPNAIFNWNFFAGLAWFLYIFRITEVRNYFFDESLTIILKMMKELCLSQKYVWLTRNKRVRGSYFINFFSCWNSDMQIAS